VGGGSTDISGPTAVATKVCTTSDPIQIAGITVVVLGSCGIPCTIDDTCADC
jgi:hypothetical protein